MLRGALIGVGNVAVHGHLPGWLGYKGVELVAAADVSPRGRGTLESLLPQARWYDRAEELLQTEALDYVDICTPPATHAGLIRSALRLGLHVLCEKPLVLRPEDLLELAEVAEERDRVLYTVHNWNHAPILAKVGELIREGAVGQIHRSLWKAIRSEPAGTADRETGNWRINPALSGGGILIDHGWHAFYVLEGWFGRAPNRVSARLEARRHREWPIEDTATVCLEYPAATAEIFLTWASEERRNCVEVEGTRGTIRVEGRTLELLESPAAGGRRRWEFRESLSEGSHHPDWFRGVVSGFLSEIAGQAPRGENLAEASKCVALLDLARESNRRGGEPLTVPAPLLSKRGGRLEVKAAGKERSR